jgi:hypothetical protein
VDPVIMASESLTTYLQDHLAGSAAAVEMLETLRDKHAGAPLGEFAADILTEVRQDQATLEDLIEQSAMHEHLADLEQGHGAGQER